MRLKYLWSKKILTCAMFLVGTSLVLSSCTSDGANVSTTSSRQITPIILPLAQREPPEKKPLIGLFVDAASTAATPDGKSWATAFPNIMDAVKASKGENIYVASGTYKSPKLDFKDLSDKRLIGGYKVGDKFEKDVYVRAADADVILDGEGKSEPLVKISGTAKRIAFLGGFVFKNVTGATAVTITGVGFNNTVRNVTIIGSRFENNDNNIPKSAGGGLYAVYAEDLRFDDVDAKNNKAGNGGFAYLHYTKNAIITRGVWENNHATEFGGALSFFFGFDSTISGQTIKNNSAIWGAGISIYGGNSQRMENIVLQENNSLANPSGTEPNGAGISISWVQNITLSRLSFAKNQVAAPGKGGALAALNVDNLKLRLVDSEVRENEAELGGAFHFEKINGLELNGGKFLQNTAKNSAGSMMFVAVTNARLTEIVVDGSVAQNFGGGIIISDSLVSFSLDHVSIKNSKANARMGGGLFIVDNAGGKGIITIENSTFEGNFALGNGGAIGTEQIKHKLIIKNTDFINNKSANYGGALALDAKSDPGARFVIGEGTRFIENSSAQVNGGGAILAVFDDALATNLAIATPSAMDHQLVFLNTSADFKKNEAAPTSFGQIMRFSNHPANDDPSGAAPTTNNTGVRIFSPLIAGRGISALNFFVAYSTGLLHTAPWDRLKFAWEALPGSNEIYAW